MPETEKCYVYGSSEHGPATEIPGGPRLKETSWAGMTLRDYLAGQALAGIMANRQIDGEDAGLASYAYRMADAMLEERAKASWKEWKE